MNNNKEEIEIELEDNNSNGENEVDGDLIDEHTISLKSDSHSNLMDTHHNDDFIHRDEETYSHG